MQVRCTGPGGKGLLGFHCSLLSLSTTSQASKIPVMEPEPGRFTDQRKYKWHRGFGPDRLFLKQDTVHMVFTTIVY